MKGHFLWNGQPLPFEIGQTLAQALECAGHCAFGQSADGQFRAVACGIGQCQNCLVHIAGVGPREACLTLCLDGMSVSAVEEDHA